MEIYQLRTFRMIAREGHLTRAAKRLNASQPAVSAHVKGLEDELGVSLFLRTPKGMVLTESGEKLLQYAETALDAVDEMSSHAGLLRGVVCGEFRIGINAEPESLRIAGLIATMNKRYPDLTIHLLQANSSELYTKLEDGLLDAGFMYGEQDAAGMFTVLLHRLPVVVAGPIEWQEKLNIAGPEDLAALPWIMTPDDCPFNTVAKNFFEKHSIQPSGVALTDQESALKTMIRSGMGLSILLNEDTRNGEKKEMAAWSQEKLVMPLSIGCLIRRKDEQVMQTLFSVLSNIWDVAEEKESAVNTEK